MQLTAGQIFADDFRVERELGRGGMGAVYVVTQLSTEKRRALKLMDEGLLADAKAAERFLQEAKVGSRVESEHVVEVIAAGVERERDRPVPWLVMELLEGETLADAVQERGPIASERAHEILRQLCHGLGAAHRAGLVHRDVKPDNIFLAEAKSAGARLKVKLLDFGIAKILQPTVDGQGSSTAPMGTPLFMAPEQTRAGVVDARADVWALGLLAYYVLTGRHYWKAANEPSIPLTALLVEISVDTIDPPSARAASQGVRVPGGFDDWFLRCVDRDVARRYANADVAWKALSGQLSGDAFAETVAGDALVAAVAAVPTQSTVTTADTEPSPSASTQPATSVDTEPSTSPAVPAGTGARPAPSSVASPNPPAAAPPAPSRAGAVVLGAGVLMLAIGGAAFGYSMRGDEPVAPTVTPTVDPAPTPTSPADAMDPLQPAAPAAAPDAGPPPDAGAPPAPAEPQEPRAPRESATDRAAREDFIRSSRLGCRSFAASQPGQRVRIRARLRIDGSGHMERWQIQPPTARACLTSRTVNQQWSATGRSRWVEFSFVVRL